MYNLRAPKFQSNSKAMDSCALSLTHLKSAFQTTLKRTDEQLQQNQKSVMKCYNYSPKNIQSVFQLIKVGGQLLHLRTVMVILKDSASSIIQKCRKSSPVGEGVQQHLSNLLFAQPYFSQFNEIAQGYAKSSPAFVQLRKHVQGGLKGVDPLLLIMNLDVTKLDEISQHQQTSYVNYLLAKYTEHKFVGWLNRVLIAIVQELSVQRTCFGEVREKENDMKGNFRARDAVWRTQIDPTPKEIQDRQQLLRKAKQQQLALQQKVKEVDEKTYLRRVVTTRGSLNKAGDEPKRYFSPIKERTGPVQRGPEERYQRTFRDSECQLQGNPFRRGADRASAQDLQSLSLLRSAV